MELVMQFVLLFLVVIHSAGARVLDDDSSQKNDHIEEKLFSGVGHMTIQQSRAEQLVLSSGQSPGVGHVSIQNVHIKGMLPSGQSPGVGHVSVQRSHPEEVLPMGVGHMVGAQSEEILPSGGSPGVGHMSIHNAHVEGMQSPAVGHMGAQDAHIDGMLSSGQSLAENIDSGKKFSAINKLPSGPSPGVGHMVINTKKSRDKNPAVSNILAANPSAEAEQGAKETLNKVPCGPSPEADNSCELGHVVGSTTEDKTSKSADHVDLIAVKEESVTVNEVPGGKSHSKEQEAQVGSNSMESSISGGGGERPQKGENRRNENDGGVIGCPDVGQASGTINVFDESTYYGAPTSLLFRVER